MDAMCEWFRDSHLKSKRRPLCYEGGNHCINWEDWKVLSRGHFKGTERIHEEISLHHRILESGDHWDGSKNKRWIGKKPEYQFFEWVKLKITQGSTIKSTRSERSKL